MNIVEIKKAIEKIENKIDKQGCWLNALDKNRLGNLQQLYLRELIK